jgi:hypothetical protein
MHTTLSTAIKASDFSGKTTDAQRTIWTVGKMRHLIAALDGAEVIVTTDARTGHTVIGAQLVSLRKTPGFGSYDVLVVTEHNRTWFSLSSIGETIIPLDASGKGAKWAALDLYREERSAAIQAAQAANPSCAWGEWSAEPGHDWIDVAYEPSTGNPAFADKWGERTRVRFDLADLTK